MPPLPPGGGRLGGGPLTHPYPIPPPLSVAARNAAHYFRDTDGREVDFVTPEGIRVSPALELLSTLV